MGLTVLVVLLFSWHACLAERLSQLIASDILWSDPSQLPGHRENKLRGVGTRFGPDVTEVSRSAGVQGSALAITTDCASKPRLCVLASFLSWSCSSHATSVSKLALGSAFVQKVQCRVVLELLDCLKRFTMACHTRFPDLVHGLVHVLVHYKKTAHMGFAAAAAGVPEGQRAEAHRPQP